MPPPRICMYVPASPLGWYSVGRPLPVRGEHSETNGLPSSVSLLVSSPNKSARAARIFSMRHSFFYMKFQGLRVRYTTQLYSISFHTLIFRAKRTEKIPYTDYSTVALYIFSNVFYAYNTLPREAQRIF